MFLLQTSLIILLLKICLAHASSQENQGAVESQATMNATASTIENAMKENPYRMKGYLIAVIVLGIFFAFVVIYKLFNHLRYKQLLSCCRADSQGRQVRRGDTFKPLIKEGEQRQSSIYKKGNSAKQPQMV